MEPQWTKAIQSETVCNFFYFFFVLYAVIAVISIVSLIYMLTATSIPKAMVLPFIVQGLVPMAIAITGTLFNYLVCSRALLKQA